MEACADPIWAANPNKQSFTNPDGHSLTVMMQDYVRWIRGADRGRNIDAVNRSINANPQ